MNLSLKDLNGVEQLPGLVTPVLLKLLAAVAIFFIGKWIAEGLIKLVRTAMRRGRVDETLADFLGNVLYGLAVAVIVLAALGALGVDTTSAAAIVGGAALAIGLSLQSQLSSLAAGVIIIMFRPFRKGDFVEIGGVKGVVEEIKIISIQLRTLDNKTLIVPNANVTTQIITNYSDRQTRRIDLTIPVSYESDLRKTKMVLEELLAAEPRVLKSPAPTIQVKALAQSSVDISVWSWTRTSDAGDVEAALLEAIKLKFDAEGIEIPYNKLAVQMQGTQELTAKGGK
jgi:small conductance mechanosensitive channel